ncbi:hypothetical protein [Hyphomicrobium sulfonivorans]|uniref:hypothetical protein n=1 Tax=Hyphomicrobium sulfonivorans TaxID=121290 RepID=UPI0015708351|nr:hypothetical protein [Hyphomicrobium sulfonivorans]MBI1650183.1 hypothetical protein [Hyphomicrobium sulfonivorans]NSL73099.1 hypothetical protein [Hyphomicrobium sulfonivorans]
MGQRPKADFLSKLRLGAVILKALGRTVLWITPSVARTLLSPLVESELASQGSATAAAGLERQHRDARRV